MQIINTGTVDIKIDIDNKIDLVIDRLNKGSIINHRSFIIADQLDVTAECLIPVTLFYMVWEKMEKIKEKCPVLSQKIDAF